MHMADALLSPAVGAAFCAGTAGAVGYCSRKLRREMGERLLPLMGVMGAFVFAAQMINFTIPGTGSSGHLGGGLLLAVLLGPHAGFLAIASVLSVQALFFADGGILALGANIWNLGFYPCFIAYPLIFKPLAGERPTRKRLMAASVAASVGGLQLGSLSVVAETWLSGMSELPLGSFLMLMQPIHLAIGVVEGVVTAGVLGFIAREKPDALSHVHEHSNRRALAVLLAAALLIGGIGAWFASERPDGLEWSLDKAGAVPGSGGQAHRVAKDIQDSTAVLPDYGFKGQTDSGASARAGATVSGVAGSLIVLVVAYAAGAALRRLGRRGRH